MGARGGHIGEAEILCLRRSVAVIQVTALCGLGRYITRMKTQSPKNRMAWLQGPALHCDGVPENSETPWRLVLLGAPGVGKGTQADLLNQRMGACHLSTGDILRAAVGRSDCEQTPAMKQALEYMRRGKLVSDATVWDLVRERITCLKCDGGFILDGFPRTAGQAESLKQLMDSEGLGLTAVVSYALPFEEIVARLDGRRTCEKCKAVYHVTERPPLVADRCDRCQGKLFRREDDRPESIKVRLQAYEQSTAPLIEFYKKLCLLIEVEAKGSPEEICNRTMAKVQEHYSRRLGPVAAFDE